jgi:hypothetical protein
MKEVRGEAAAQLSLAPIFSFFLDLERYTPFFRLILNCWTATIKYNRFIYCFFGKAFF